MATSLGRARTVAVWLVVASASAACAADDGGGDTEAGSSPSPSAAASQNPTPSEASSSATVQVAESDLGSILVDEQGMTLYLFESDSDGASTCYDECEDAWPPLIADSPTAGEGVDGSLLGTTKRDDGALQVTYDGQPLYLFAADRTPGDVEGQGVGDVWFVLDPSGRKVTEAARTGPGY
jgi:predicted lipoprotein with Yx(FWY)xxD motif